MEELMDFAKGKENEVEVEKIQLEEVNKMSEIRLSVMGRNEWLERLDEDITVERLNAKLGEGFADYRLLTEGDPRDFVFNLSDKYPSLQFVYNFNKREDK